ncbi:MAG: hypothetical protein ABSA83_08845 [Verrucomicrobiota bacterium]|jgi:hypothetical protein
MAQNDNDLQVTLPEELRRQFADVQRRLWRVETTVALCSILAGLVASLLALFISDRLWDTPPGLRLVFSLLGLAVVVASFCHWARRWLWHRRSLKDLANLVQKEYRRLGDRLLGIVELAQEQRHLANFSPALYYAAIHQVADEARQYDFLQSVSARSAEKFALGAGALTVCWLGLWLTLPQVGWNAFLRWLSPTANIPRYTLVVLEDVPRELIVPHGEPFDVSGHVRYRSFWKPGRVSGQLPALLKIEGAVNSGNIRLQIPGQVANGLLRIEVGDAMEEIKLVPVPRPSLRELAARIQLPDYLHYPDQIQVLQSGSLLAVEGSRIAFHGTVTRALSAALMQPEGGAPAPLKIDGANFDSPPADPEGIAQYTFNWRDDLGLSNASPLRLAVAMQKDAPPVAALPGLPQESAMLASDVLHIRAEASDDFGVRDFGLTWDVVSDTPLQESIATEEKVMTPTPSVKKTARVFLWSPQAFRIPADSTVELQGYARDFFPERERSRTAPYRIRVLSPEEHAELVRQQLEGVLASIEDVTRLQEKIAANLGDLQDHTNLPESQKSARVGESKNEQLENSSSLDELSQQAAQALQEAMKNPIFPADTIRQWSQSAQQWQQLARKNMKDAAAAMQSAQKESASRPQQVAEAAQKAEDILDALAKMQDKAGRRMDDLQALTLSQRLRKVGTQEKEISVQLLKSAPDIIGLPPEDLPGKLKRLEHGLTTDQSGAQKESDTLGNEISRFFERTQKTNYGAVSREMKDSRAGDELEHLGGLIGDNIAMEASRGLSQWSGRFQKWGDQLEPKTGDSGSGQGSDGKSQKKDLTDQLVALLRLRQNEWNLRDQTSALDQQKGDPAAFKDKANALAGTQNKLGRDLDTIHQQIALPQLEADFAETGGAMAEVEAILQKPQTDQAADQAEGKTIDSLSDLVNLINEQAQRGSPQPSPGDVSSAAEMAFLLRMMQNPGNDKTMAVQPASGLHHAGGKTDRAGNPVSGNADGKGAAARKVDKAAGVIENSPAEFRDALDNYFHGIEQSKE